MPDYRSELESISLSDGRKEQLVARLERATESAGSDSTSSPSTARQTAGIIALLLFFASLVGSGAYAMQYGLSSLPEPLESFFGSGAPADVVESIGTPLHARAQECGISVTATSAIRDRRNVAVVYEVSRMDGQAFEGLEEHELSGVLNYSFLNDDSFDETFLGNGGGIYMHSTSMSPDRSSFQYVEVAQHAGRGSFASTYTRHLTSLGRWPIPTEDGYWDGEFEELYPCTWALSFKLTASDMTIATTGHGARIYGTNGSTRVTRVEVSPLSVRIFARSLADLWDLDSYDPSASEWLVPRNVTLDFADGTHQSVDYETDYASSSGGRFLWSTYEWSQYLSPIVDVASVVSVTIDGQVIPLH